jgi:RNA polymerase sigma-70 factor (ECF subfamily)
MSTAFEDHRARLVALAYRVLGSRAEADDVVQEAHLRFLRTESPVDSPKAWLDRVVTNLCLDQLKSARVARETYVGTWLPEPVATEGGRWQDGPADPESISLAFLSLLELLSPLERAVYVLAEAFDYAPDEIASVLAKEPAAVRQTLHRAREHVRAGRPRFAPSAAAHERLLSVFLGAVMAGDVSRVEALLAADAVARTDGGGRAKAALRDIRGAQKVARFVFGLAKKVGPELHLEVREINGWPALVVFDGMRPVNVISVETDGERIYSLFSVVNPDKLERLF